MKRRSRELALFNLSALDVLAMATGTFVLIVVLLLPYYRKSFEANAEIADTRVAIAELQAETEELTRAATADADAARSSRARAASLESAAGEQRSMADSLESEAAAMQNQAGKDVRDAEELREILEKRIIKELDLVFVVDTTASMTPALEELSFSLSGIIRILERLVPSLRVGVVAYRDHDFGTWVTRRLEPTPTDTGANRIYDFVGNLRAARRGGPTPQEAVLAGVREALALPLRPDAKLTIIVMGDASAHNYEQSATLQLARQFAGSGPRRNISALFISTPSQRRFGRGAREFFVELARAGQGEFKDHSGQMIESVLLSVLDQ